MRVDYHFGTRQVPAGLLPKSEWDLIKPEWKQVHGTDIVQVEHHSQPCGNVDGFWTTLPEQVIAVVTADCVPVLLERNDHQAVAALHAGWRGIEANIVKSFFNALPKDLAQGSAWKATLGPSIRACCYEVSEELIQQFKAAFPDLDFSQISPTPRKLDLIQVVKHQLKSQGVGSVVVHPDCTFCSKDSTGEFRYFSYRRGDRNSRQYAMIKLTKSRS